MNEVIYLLCAMTSVACAVMLLRGYLRSRTRLLLWSSLCFISLAANNVLLFISKLVLPDHDLQFLRWASAVAAIAVMLYGLIWDSQ